MLGIKSTFYILITIAFLIIVWAAPLAKADENSSNITAFPAVIEANIDPGATFKTDLVITNKSNKPLPIEIETKSLVPVDEILDIEKRKDFDASRWVEIDNGSLAIESGQSKKVKINIDIPPSARPGGRYAEIIIKELALQSSQLLQNGSTIQPQVNIPVLLTVNGESKEEILIESRDKFPEFIGWNSTLNTNITIANTGTTHLLPTIEFVTSKKNTIMSSFSYSPGIILPNTKKTLTIEWKPNLPIGLYDIETIVKFGDNKIASSEPERVMVFFPLWIILGFLVASVTGGYLLAKRKNIANSWRVLLKYNK